MKKHLFSILFFFIFAVQTFAIGTYQIGDKLYILAKSGLTLRAKPDPNGEKVAIVGYATAVTVSTQDLRDRKSHSVDDSGYKLNGFWVKVKADGKEGYIFDGYLSKLKAPSKTPFENLKDGEDFIETYYATNSAKAGQPIPFIGNEPDYPKYQQKYQDGALIEMERHEVGVVRHMRLPKGTSLEEGYLIGKNLWFSEAKNLKATMINSDGTEWDVKNDEEENSFLGIKKIDGFIVVSMSFAD